MNNDINHDILYGLKAIKDLDPKALELYTAIKTSKEYGDIDMLLCKAEKYLESIEKVFN